MMTASCLYLKPRCFYSDLSEKQPKPTKGHLWALQSHKIQHLANLVLYPTFQALKSVAHLVNPLPGENKNQSLKGLLVRIYSLMKLILLLPLIPASIVLGLFLKRISHLQRPWMEYISPFTPQTTIPSKPTLTREQPLHIRTHNVALGPSYFRIAGDLRSTRKRALELVEHINHDPKQPDIIFLQEAFAERSVETLCEGIKKNYPYIIKNIAPHISGFSSGTFIASKYPIQNIYFEQFKNMRGPEKLSPRGITRIKLDTHQGPLMVYSVHLQAFYGDKRAAIRREQSEQIYQLMKADREKNPECMQVLTGDFNTSRLTLWGEDNLTPPNQAEESPYSFLNHHFTDLFYNDHDPLTGQRLANSQPQFLAIDNQRIGYSLPEPRGSWYHGPLYHPGALLSLKILVDRWLHKRPFPKTICSHRSRPNLWGTKQWRQTQYAFTAKLDSIFVWKTTANNRSNPKLQGTAEIRRTYTPINAQSASSDHLAVDALIYKVTIKEKNGDV